MNLISITYTLKYQISFAPEYKFSVCKKCFNTKTGRQIKKVYNNGCLGYSIRGNFKSLHRLRKELVKIESDKIPF